MSEVAPDVFDSLTPEQLQALRLAREGFTSKEIARQLEITRWAVDQRIERARARLGAGDRNEAIRMLGAWERATERPGADLATPAPPSERVVREPSQLAAGAEPAMLGASYAGPSTAADTNRLREMSAAFGNAGISLLRLGEAKGQGEGRSALQTILRILMAALVVAILMIAMPSLIQNTKDIANSVKPYKGATQD